MTAIRGAAAALTGAASGIGRALALELAARGCDLALADRDEAGLQTLAAELAKSSAVKVTTIGSTSPSRPRSPPFAQTAATAHPGLNILINNAGVALMGTFAEIDQAQMDWLMNINFWGVVHATRAFLPHLAQRREAQSSTCPRSSASSRRRDKPPMRRRNSRCAAFPKACGTSCRPPKARSGCRWCIPAASPPTSPATPAPASASPTMPAAPNRSSASTTPRAPRPPPPRCASSPASKKTSRAS